MSAAPSQSVGWLAAGLLSLVLANASPAGPIRPGFDAAALPAGDDASSNSIDLGFALNFFGQTFASVYVNTNGNVSFGAPLSDFTPVPLGQLRQAVIAPIFADADTTAVGRVSYGTATVEGRPAFAATWSGVGHYDAKSDRTNTFQAVLVDRSDTGAGNFDVEFNYEQVQWEAGDFNGGIGGAGGSTARAGVTGDGAMVPGGFYELPGSGVPGAFLDTGYAALAGRLLNSNTPGRYVLHARDGSFEEVRTTPTTGGGLPIPAPPASGGVVGAPEPGTMALAAIGISVVVLRMRRGNRSERG